MVIIFMDSMEDTAVFKDLYRDLDATVLINPSKRKTLAAIRKENDTVVMFGHGCSEGLFGVEWFDAVVDDETVPYLQGKKLVGIWCYAKEFAIANKLSGWFTDMWVSNAVEAEYEGIACNDNEIIFQENILFANRLNQLLKDGTPLEKWSEILATQYEKTELNEFNYTHAGYVKFE